MDLHIVLPRFRDALAPGAALAIVDNTNIHGPYREEILRRLREVVAHVTIFPRQAALDVESRRDQVVLLKGGRVEGIGTGGIRSTSLSFSNCSTARARREAR